MKALVLIALLLTSSSVLAQVQFPEPDWEVTATGDEIFSTGVTRTVGDSGPIFLMVDASYTAVARNNGNRRNTQATLEVLVNGQACGWDSFGNEFATSVVSSSVHCFVRGSGPCRVEARATLSHCCEGGHDKWPDFQARKSIVNIYAFRAEVPAKKKKKRP